MFNRKKIKQSLSHQDGFTLIELMISIAVFGVVMAAVYMVYQAQLRSYYTQQQIADMQQNLRSSLYLMEREIKMAGLNPTGDANIGIITADSHTFDFSMDFTGGAGNGVDDDDDGIIDECCDGLDNNGNGLKDEADEAEWFDGDDNDPNERITYILSNDADADGINDGLPTENDDDGVCNLLRNGEILALNIDGLNFVYLDRNGDPLATPVAAAKLSDIRSIQISMVARTEARSTRMSHAYTDTRNYRNQQNGLILPQQNDPYRRIIMSTEIRCRNMGLQ